MLLFYLKPNLFIILGTIIIANICVGYLIREYSLQPIEVILTKERITINFLSYNLSRRKRSLSVAYDKISRFSDFSNGSDLKFKLFFNQGKVFSIYKSSIWSKKDDFQNLINDFKIIIEGYNLKQALVNNVKNTNKIKYGDNTYLIFALICFGFSILIGFTLFDSLLERNPNYKALTGFIILLAGGIINLGIHKNKKGMNK